MQGVPSANLGAPTNLGIDAVESKLAQQLRQELIAATQALSPEQRLEAFLEHSQLMAELYEAGRHLRAEADSKRS